MLYTDDTFYQGNWTNDVKDGFGVERGYNYEYEGYFQNNFKHGFGCFNDWKNNKRYIGEWIRGKKNGQGKLYEKNKVFEGYWSENKKHGFGITQSKNVIYQGIYKNGKKHGVFTFLKFESRRIFKVKYNYKKEYQIQTH